MNQLKVLAIHGSPRPNGNSKLLLDAFLDAPSLKEPWVKVERLKPGIHIHHCLGCDRCISGVCVHKDAMVEIYEKLKTADLIVLAAPVYFYGFPSHVKAMMDRCQLFFNQKYRKKESWRKSPGIGAILCCGATNGKNLFAGMKAVAKYWFDALDFELKGEVFARQTDEVGEILKHPEVLEKAKSLGIALTEEFKDRF